MTRTNPSTKPSTTEALALVTAERAKRASKKAATPKAATPAPTHTAAQDAREAKTPKAEQKGGETVLRTGRLSARGLPCLCGCGNPTHTKDARFLSGHDAKLRKEVLLRGAEALPEVVRPFFFRGEEVAGLTVTEEGVVTDHKPQASRSL